jgi:formiminoglutamase
MNVLKFYTKTEILAITNTRDGETKLGQVVEVLANQSQLETSSSTYVLLGIPEDIGVRANNGKAGTSTAWKEGLTAFCNIQVNNYTNSESIAILGAINCDKEMHAAEKINDVSDFGKLVSEIDKKVTSIVEKIVASGKIPIIIGGGHNNSYGNLKGTSVALNKSINCVNLDAHTDFRSLEHRHSGNGFSYAQQEGFLDKYFIFGLHRNYTSQAVFDAIEDSSDKLQFNFFEAILVEKSLSFKKALEQASAFCCHTSFGIELDMDAIANMGSSAMTPSGFSVENARHFLNYFSANKHCAYIHICEGSPSAALFPSQIGKTISYLISDIISE